MKNLLITGGAGYIGSVLSEQLIEKNYKVTCVDKLDFGSDSLVSLKKMITLNYIISILIMLMILKKY